MRGLNIRPTDQSSNQMSLMKHETLRPQALHNLNFVHANQDLEILAYLVSRQ